MRQFGRHIGPFVGWIGLAIVVIAGGLSKASWKLLWVLSGINIMLLSNLLFILMAPGMILLACHVYAAGRCWRGLEQGAPGRTGVILIIATLGLAAFAANAQAQSSRPANSLANGM